MKRKNKVGTIQSSLKKALSEEAKGLGGRPAYDYVIKYPMQKQYGYLKKN